PAARQVDLVTGIPAAFQLAHFAAYDFVPRAVVPGDIDAAHVNPPAGIDEERERRLVLAAVQVGRCIDVGKGITVIAQAVADVLGRLGYACPRVGFTRLDGDQLQYLRLGQQKFAGNLDIRHRVLRTFGDADA